MKLHNVFIGWAGLSLSACIDVPIDDKPPSSLEEPSSEPAGEPSDPSEDNSDSSTDSDGSNDAGSWGDDESSSDSEDNSSGSIGGTLNPDLLLFSFQNGYVNGNVANTGTSVVGSFSLYLFDSMNEQYCAIDWIFDETTVAPDPEYNDGFVIDGFYGTELEVWYGFVVLAQPQTREACDDLTSDWLITLDEIKADRPGFGYGPLTEDLMMSMETDHYAGWDAISDIIFTGIPSMTVFSEGERMYFPVNQGFAYGLDDSGVTTYDPNLQESLQGSELTVSTLPSDGFYVGSYYYAISLGGH